MLKLHYLSDELNSIISSFCEERGFVVEDNQITYIGSVFGEYLIAYQIPEGMPFGILKPDFSITAERERQTLKYEL